MQSGAFDERSQLEIIFEEHNQREALRKQLEGRKRAIEKREARLDQISRFLRARSDALDEKKRFLDEKEKRINNHSQALQSSPSQPPAHLPPNNQPDRPLDFAYMQANLLNIPNSQNPIQIGGYGPLARFGALPDDVMERRLYARGLHHGAQIGVWVSTIADHNAPPGSTSSATADFNANDSADTHDIKQYGIDKLSDPFAISVPKHRTHSQDVAGAATTEVMRATSRTPRNTLGIALANPAPYFDPRGPGVGALSPRAMSTGSVDLLSLAPNTATPRNTSLPVPSPSQYSLQTPPHFPQHKQLLAVKGRLPKPRMGPGGQRRHASTPERRRPSMLAAQAQVPRPRASSQPPHLPPQLPAGLVSELPPFRRAALAAHASGPAFPAVELRNPTLPPGRTGAGESAFHATAPLGPGPYGEDEGAYGRSLAAVLLAETPGQTDGVFVNGIVLKGCHLPRLAAAMTPREGQILYVVYPWMGEPVAYV